MARISNQILCVCAFLSNFKPVLVPGDSSPTSDDEQEVEEYFEGLSDSDSSKNEEDGAD